MAPIWRLSRVRLYHHYMCHYHISIIWWHKSGHHSKRDKLKQCRFNVGHRLRRWPTLKRHCLHVSCLLMCPAKTSDVSSYMGVKGKQQ